MSSMYNINNIIMVNLYNDFILLSTTESKDNIYLKTKKVLESIPSRTERPELLEYRLLDDVYY